MEQYPSQQGSPVVRPASRKSDSGPTSEENENLRRDTGRISKVDQVLGDAYSSVELIQSVGSDALIAAAARVSHANDLGVHSAEKDERLLRYLLTHDHGTPFEHNLITYRWTAPLYVIQELLRHRIGFSFNQESARYIEVKNRAYVPKVFRTQATGNHQSSVECDTLNQGTVEKIYSESVDFAYQSYEALIANGVAREHARGVLPHCTYASLYVTCNVRSLMHFLELRLAEGAQWEIRQYAKAMLSLAEPLFPTTLKLWKEISAV